MKFKNLFWGAAACAAVGLAGCSGGDNSGGTTTGGTTAATTGTTTSGATADKGAKKDLKIAMIAKSSTNPVFQSAKTGAEAAAKELGAKNGINITIDWRTPSDEDAQVQAQRIAQ